MSYSRLQMELRGNLPMDFLPQLAVCPRSHYVFNTEWLRDELRLHFDPFRELDAGADTHLTEYLVGYGPFEKLWGHWPSFLFAPAGGGKTAFRVRLARACRVQQDGRRVFAAPFCPPRPDNPAVPLSESVYLGALLNAIAASLLLELAYRPDRFLDADAVLQQDIHLFLEQHLPGSLGYYLTQLEQSGSLQPLALAFDPAAIGLPGEPLPDRLRSFCAALRSMPSESISPTDPQTQLEQIVELLKNRLRYEAVYLLVDGVDAYVQEPSLCLQLLEPLLARLRAWEKQALFVKCFLPRELQPILKQSAHQSLLTSPTKVVIITWKAADLANVVRERLRVASEGMFDSLSAIATPDVENRIDDHLANQARPSVPRELVLLVQRVFYEHAGRVGPYGRLEQQDFDAALRWYKGNQRSAGGRPPAR